MERWGENWKALHVLPMPCPVQSMPERGPVLPYQRATITFQTTLEDLPRSPGRLTNAAGGTRVLAPEHAAFDRESIGSLDARSNLTDSLDLRPRKGHGASAGHKDGNRTPAADYLWAPSDQIRLEAERPRGQSVQPLTLPAPPPAAVQLWSCFTPEALQPEQYWAQTVPPPPQFVHATTRLEGSPSTEAAPDRQRRPSSAGCDVPPPEAVGAGQFALAPLTSRQRWRGSLPLRGGQRSSNAERPEVESRARTAPVGNGDLWWTFAEDAPQLAAPLQRTGRPRRARAQMKPPRSTSVELEAAEMKAVFLPELPAASTLQTPRSARSQFSKLGVGGWRSDGRGAGEEQLWPGSLPAKQHVVEVEESHPKLRKLQSQKPFQSQKSFESQRRLSSPDGGAVDEDGEDLAYWEASPDTWAPEESLPHQSFPPQLQMRMHSPPESSDMETKPMEKKATLFHHQDRHSPVSPARIWTPGIAARSNGAVGGPWLLGDPLATTEDLASASPNPAGRKHTVLAAAMTVKGVQTAVKGFLKMPSASHSQIPAAQKGSAVGSSAMTRATSDKPSMHSKSMQAELALSIGAGRSKVTFLAAPKVRGHRQDHKTR